MRLFWISSQKKSFRYILITPHVENKFWSSYETFESAGKIKNWWWNFTCVRTMSLNIEIYRYLLGFPWEIVFSFISGNSVDIPLAFRKWIKDCNILNSFLVQGFCQPKTDISRFHVGFGRKLFVVIIQLFQNQRTIMRE